MGKTTIDGLAVRSSSSNSRANSTTRRPATHRNTNDSRTRQAANQQRPRQSYRRTTASVSEPLILNSIDITQQSGHQVEDFSATYQSSEPNDFDGAGFTADENDWSDLLDGFSEAKAVQSSGNDFLDDNADNFFGDLDEEPKTPKRRAPRKKKFKKRKIIKTAVFSVLGLTLAAAIIAVIWGDQIISKLTNGKSGIWDAVWSLVSDEIPFEEDANGRTNILVFGTEGYDMDGSAGDGSIHQGSQLTDSIMVVSFDQKTKDVALISIPRDLKVSMACSVGKINEVYSCHNGNGNDEAAGAEALATQLSEVLGIDFQYWAHVNWGSLADIVDLLGGITVTLDENVNDYNYTTMVVQAGIPTELNGVQAVALARARHGTVGGDFSRGNTQQKILEGIVAKVVSSKLGFTDAINLLNILGDNFRSNFSSENIKSGVSLATNFDINNIRQVPLVNYEDNVYYVRSETINGVSYVVPSAGQRNYTDIQGYVARMLNSDPAVREGALLAVYNSSWVDGAAEAEQAGLEVEGYNVIATGEAYEYDCTDTYCLYNLNDAMPATAEALRNKYQVDLRPADELPRDIYPGHADFVIIIGNTSE